jgi:hypothetical protein
MADFVLEGCKDFLEDVDVYDEVLYVEVDGVDSPKFL